MIVDFIAKGPIYYSKNLNRSFEFKNSTANTSSDVVKFQLLKIKHFFDSESLKKRKGMVLPKNLKRPSKSIRTQFDA
jgi:hypothetical protein